MNKRLRKKYKWCKCVHLHRSRYAIDLDCYTRYEDETYCKIKDFDTPYAADYINGYCLLCRHFHPNIKAESEYRQNEKAARRYSKKLSQEEKDQIFNFNFDF